LTNLSRFDGVTNMGLDSELLEAAELGQIGWRVYGWDGVWVSVGRFQNAERDLIDPAGTFWTLRPTGGKAVLHGHDVTVALAVPLAALQGVDPRSIKAVYRAVVSPLVDALLGSGVNATLAADTVHAGRGVRSGDCFAFSSPNDIVETTTGRKLCGCALRLTQSAVLVQASIPNGPPLVDPTTVIRNAERSEPFTWDASRFEDTFERAIRVGF